LTTVEKPREALFTLLLDYGITSIGSKAKPKELPVLKNKFQQLLVHMLLTNNVIRITSSKGWTTLYEEPWNNTIFTLCKREVRTIHVLGEVRAVYPGEDMGLTIRLEQLMQLIPQPIKPLFIVDLKYWNILLDKEKNLLLNQISFTLSVLREYLWDLNLALTSTPLDIVDKINQFSGHNKIRIEHRSLDKVIEEYKTSKIVVLDPNAEEPLMPRDLDEVEVYIVGGIVDKIVPRQGLTSTLAREYGLPTRKVVLRGSIIGVPCRINKIVEIILKAKYETHKDIDLAIKLSQSRIDARWRAYREIIEYTRRQGRLTIPRTLYDELSKWLNLSWKDFIQAAKMARTEIT